MSLITPAIRQELASLYSSSARHYHSLAHVNALLALLDAHRHRFSDPDAVEAAVWFHDAVYDPGAKGDSNEVRSADLAVARLSGALAMAQAPAPAPTADSAKDGPRRLEWIRTAILATATHTLPEDLEGSRAADAALFLDMDLAILGASEAVFDRYEADVRLEYGFVDDETWRAGRASVLRRFLGRERIYQSAVFRELYEDAARANLRRSLRRLEAEMGA